MKNFSPFTSNLFKKFLHQFPAVIFQHTTQHRGLGMQGSGSKQMKAFFVSEGYPVELYETWRVDDEMKALAEKIPGYPEDGYIVKVGDVFVVNCGN